MNETSFKEWKSSRYEGFGDEFRERMDNMQLTVGKVLELNLIKAAQQLDLPNHIKVDKVSQDIDLFFGADLKVTYISDDHEINNMSSYIDVTCNLKKPNMIILDEQVCRLSNGITVGYGVKTNNTYFNYRKPILVIVLRIDHDIKFNPFFTQDDIMAVMYGAIAYVKHISYNLRFTYGEEFKQGGGKRASELVIPKYKRTRQPDCTNYVK